MPLYTFACKACGYRDRMFRKIAERNDETLCGVCNAEMQRVLEAPRVATDYAGYDCPVTGKWVEGRRAHEENLKRTGCRLLEPGESRQAAQQAQAEDDGFADSIAESAARTVASWDSAKQERLANELAAGVDVTLTRA